MNRNFVLPLITSIAAVGFGSDSYAQATGGRGSASAGQSPSQIEEVVVTAEKKSEALKNTPVPVSVLNTQDLVAQNQTSIRDYFSEVPSLSFSSGSRGEIFPNIRGIGTGSYTNPTVGFVIDGVPYGASAISFPAPDIDPDDLERIEVLRGPQGTLFGTDSLGGLINYVTKDPTTSEFGGQITAGTSDVYNGSGAGYEFRGSANIPLSSTLAARVSAFATGDPGYIDNPARDASGINEARSYGGRATLLWTPIDTFSVKLSGSIQHERTDGSNESFDAAGFGYLKQNFLPGVGGYVQDIREFSGTIKAQVSGIDITSVTGYFDGQMAPSLDLSSAYGPFVVPVFGVSGVALHQEEPIKKFSQEIRLSGAIASKVDWLVGGFYTREAGNQVQTFDAIDPANFHTVGIFGKDQYPYNYRESAAFGDITYHLTEKFDVQAGGRISWEVQPSYVEATSGPIAQLFLGSNPSYATTLGANATPFTYLVTPEYKFSDDMMLYARFASGYRAGGGNKAVSVAAGAPSSYGPDKTQNYELGLKGDVLGEALTYDFSAYYISWNDMQTVVEDSLGIGYTANAGQAKSQGIEFSLHAEPVSGMTVDGWFAYNDAAMTRVPSNAGIIAAPGDLLPYSEPYSANVSLQQEFQVTSDVEGFVGGAISYVGRRLGNFGSASSDRQVFPSYAKLDLHASLESDRWSLNVYANNVTNSRGIQGGGLDTFPTYAFSYIQPRTIGMSVTRRF